MITLSPGFGFYQEYPIEENFLTDIVSEKKEKIISYFTRKFDELPKKIKDIERKLSGEGVDVSKIKKNAKNAAEKANTSGKRISGFKETVSLFVSDFKEKKYFVSQSAAENEDDDENEMSTTQKIFASLGILAVVLFLNYFFYGIALKLVGSQIMAYKISAIFTAPLIEEYGKRFSVKHNLTGVYFTIFTIQEFIRYALSPMTSIIGMIPQILMHAITTGIHAVTKKNDSMLGYWVSVAIHVIYNTLAVLYGAPSLSKK